MDLVQRFNIALEWICKHSLEDQGIAVSSSEMKSYPEVSGYFIPSLLAWNEKNIATIYGEWLLSCQCENGAWLGPDGKQYVFDTGQILKGLLALYEIQPDNPNFIKSISSAAKWITSFVADDGSISSVPDIQSWGNVVPRGVLLYSLQAVRRAGDIFKQVDWIEKVDKAISWFLRQKKLTHFTHLSHFHAYILESLCDLGYFDRASEGMSIVGKLQRKNGSVPAYENVHWICSTGLFQYAIVWYKLGEKERADEAFDFAASLQNRSGGWYGSYPANAFLSKITKKHKPTYFPKAEISWAVKYFLDALMLHLSVSEDMANIFPLDIDISNNQHWLIQDKRH